MTNYECSLFMHDGAPAGQMQSRIREVLEGRAVRLLALKICSESTPSCAVAMMLLVPASV